MISWIEKGFHLESQEQQMHEQHEGAPPDGAMSGDGVGVEMEEEGGHSIEMENEQMDDVEG